MFRRAIILFYLAKKLASNDVSDDLSVIQSKLKSIDKSKIEKGANSYVQKMLLAGVLLLIVIAFTEIFIK